MADEPVVIRLAETGALLGGRPLAATLRERVVARAAQSPVIVDLAGIRAISPSFADELFAKLDMELLRTKRVTIRAEHPFVEMIDAMIARRAVAES
jgi:anti-anti-sigma regulatory factor